MTFDIKTEWTCPSVNEVFLITDNGTPVMKVKCVEGKGGKEECAKCVWYDTCSKCAYVLDHSLVKQVSAQTENMYIM